MGKKTIQEIARILVEKNNLTAAEANRFVVEMFSVILQRLQADELVKVKGLGTFKIINVEARESVSVRTGERVVIDSHSKVAFTPDTVMKELVNKPFSQFETVALNDGVEFSDLQEEATEEETVESVAEEEAAAPVVEPAPVVEEPQPAELQFVVEDEPEPVVEEPQAAEPQFVVEEEPQPVVEVPRPIVEAPKPVAFAADEDEEAEARPWGRWLAIAASVLVLMAFAAYGGYEYGCRQQTVAVADTVWVRDTVLVPEESVDVTAVEEVVKEEVQEKPAAEAVQEKPAAEKVQEKPTAEDVIAERYAAKDDRVRLGAYRIVGTAEEITVQPGQTFYSICRGHLGPDMECYIEVYNDLPRNPKIKAGQKLKIPKLQVKKRRK